MLVETVGLAGVSQLEWKGLLRPRGGPCALSRDWGTVGPGERGPLPRVPPTLPSVPHTGRGARPSRGPRAFCELAGTSERGAGTWESGILGGLTHDHQLASLLP